MITFLIIRQITYDDLRKQPSKQFFVDQSVEKISREAGVSGLVGKIQDNQIAIQCPDEQAEKLNDYLEAKGIIHQFGLPE